MWRWTGTVEKRGKTLGFSTKQSRATHLTSISTRGKMGDIRRADSEQRSFRCALAVAMSIKTKCIRCSQFFGAPDQTLGKVAKCPYCGAPNDIVDLSSDDDELAALIEEERKKVGGKRASSAFSDPLRRPLGRLPEELRRKGPRRGGRRPARRRRIWKRGSRTWWSGRCWRLRSSCWAPGN